MLTLTEALLEELALVLLPSPAEDKEEQVEVEVEAQEEHLSAVALTVGPLSQASGV